MHLLLHPLPRAVFHGGMWARSPSQLSHVQLPVGLNNFGQPLGSVDENTKKFCSHCPRTMVPQRPSTFIALAGTYTHEARLGAKGYVLKTMASALLCCFGIRIHFILFGFMLYLLFEISKKDQLY